MSSIFISYRRDDTAGEAGRLQDRLVARFGRPRIFMDVDVMEPGLDFVQVIEEHIGKCSVLLVMVGRSWLVADEQGQRRIDDPGDHHRLEIQEALKRRIRVIPVLVQGASMPAEDELPDGLKKFARRHAHEISANRWDFDVNQLFEVVERVLERDKAAVPAPADVDAGQFDTRVVEAALHAIDTVGVEKLRRQQLRKLAAEAETASGLKARGVAKPKVPVSSAKPPAAPEIPIARPAVLETSDRVSTAAPVKDRQTKEKKGPIATRDEPVETANRGSGLGWKVAAAVAAVVVLAVALWPRASTDQTPLPESVGADAAPVTVTDTNAVPPPAFDPAPVPVAEALPAAAESREEEPAPADPRPVASMAEPPALEPEPASTAPGPTPAEPEPRPTEPPQEAPGVSIGAAPVADTVPDSAPTEPAPPTPTPPPEPAPVPVRTPAQSGLQGTFQDTSGEVAGVTVRLVEEESGETLETTTNGEGEYRFLRVPAGVYGISFIRDDQVVYERPQPLSIGEGDFLTYGINITPGEPPQ